MQEVVGSKDPEFWPESHCPFFSLPTGSSSCYSDEMTATLATLASDGTVNLHNLSSSIQTVFGAEQSPYQVALAKRADKKYPIAGPWLNGGVIKSLDNMSKGVSPSGSESCEDNDGFTSALPAFLVTMDIEKGREVANLLTVNSVAMAHYKVQNLIIANIINKVDDPIVSAKNSIAAENPEVAAEMDEVMSAVKQGLTVSQIVSKFGKACGLPGSFQGALASILLASDFVQWVRAIILAGGDCCARANYMVAVFGAKFGIEAIPRDQPHGPDY